jgi:hypothetical protein
MLNTLIESLEKGISMNNYTVNAHKITPGRFREEQNIELHYRTNNKEGFLLYAKIFHGRPPDYLPWVELFDINDNINVSATQSSYFNSSLENLVLRTFSETLGSGARLFVEYYNDTETREELQMGFPVVLSRLGFEMFRLGFTWFKDWYFPEGYMEGNQKLQGEKAVNTEAREKHTRNIIDELKNFANEATQTNAATNFTQHAFMRSAKIISMVNS